MNQPLSNNAIPPHPAITAQHTTMPQPAAPAAEPVSTPAPSEPTEQQNALWDAFEGTSQVSSPDELPPPPVQAAPQLPAQPPPPPELPVSVEDLLSGATPVAAPVQEEPPSQQPVAPVPVSQPASAPVDFGALQQQAINHLMANEYRLSDEDRTQLISAPDEVLPRLAARMHVGIATQLAQQVAQAIPMMIQQHLDGHVKAQRAEMDFFARYPKLNRTEWKPIIAESLRTIKAMNPQDSREDVIRKGAALAAFQIQSAHSNRSTPQPPQPPRGSAQPYVPVAPGGGFNPPTNPNQQTNIWSDLADQDWNPF